MCRRGMIAYAVGHRITKWSQPGATRGDATATRATATDRDNGLDRGAGLCPRVTRGRRGGRYHSIPRATREGMGSRGHPWRRSFGAGFWRLGRLRAHAAWRGAVRRTGMPNAAHGSG
uniref:Uncharacterized protein n=1 Tax=Oryza glumipatula TaxID=40148 RepID=A0A0E0A9Z5_9ORYZ